MIIAFDVDGTLIKYDETPRRELVALAQSLARAGHTVIVWSGGGQPYAQGQADRLGLSQWVTALDKFMNDVTPDISIDDTDGAAIRGNVMLQVVGGR